MMDLTARRQGALAPCAGRSGASQMHAARPLAPPLAPQPAPRAAVVVGSSSSPSSSSPSASGSSGTPFSSWIGATKPPAPAGPSVSSSPGVTASRGPMTAAEKLKMLEEAKKKSTTALANEAYNPYRAGVALGAGSVDLKVYQNALDSQKRLNEKISEQNKYITHLEQRVEQTDATAETAATFLKQMSMEFGTTARLAEAAAAAMRFGVDREEAVDKIKKLTARLKTMEDAVQRQRAEFSYKVVRRMPVAWTGVASEVKLMGDFDGWSRGFELSAANIETDSVYRSFEAQVPLLPGTYRVKLLVDGQWRPASDWPTETNEVGETNNVLKVKPEVETKDGVPPPPPPPPPPPAPAAAAKKK